MDTADLLNFAFDEDFAPTKAKLLPEGKPTGMLEELGDGKLVSEGKWYIQPCKFVVDDADYLSLVGRDNVSLTYDLVIEMDQATGKMKAPTDADDETNNNYRRFVKALGGTTKQPLSSLLGKRATLIVKHEVMKDKEKNALLDDEGNPRIRAKVVAVGKAAA